MRGLDHAWSVSSPRSSESERLSRAFYAALGADGLAARTRPEFDRRIIGQLIELLPDLGRVLDVGCGYGRIAVPLAKAGFTVSGLDLSPTMITAARQNAESADVAIEFVVGSMTALPYEVGSFDVIVCLWTAFYELLRVDEQEAALSEMWRVLAPGGSAIVEGPVYVEATPAEIASNERQATDQRVRKSTVEGLINVHYAHDAQSLGDRCRAAGIDRWRVEERDWGGRRRMLLTFVKDAAPIGR
jgi:2-polyprenyl-3-methyl-5-hydroxy-6-metoxy-1,4-benzoquinol methylase